MRAEIAKEFPSKIRRKKNAEAKETVSKSQATPERIIIFLSSRGFSWLLHKYFCVFSLGLCKFFTYSWANQLVNYTQFFLSIRFTFFLDQFSPLDCVMQMPKSVGKLSNFG